MAKRKIIKIDEEKCDGCGLCIPSCPEGALQLIDGKAKLVKESFCDGLGACLGECPQGALTIEEREAEEYDEEGVIAHIKEKSPELLHKHEKKEGTVSELRQWPIQLHLVPPHAPYFQNADLILVADCIPFAYANFHAHFLKGRAIAIGCPKLDDPDAYVTKLTRILKSSDIKSLTVLHMEVPCCFGLVHIAREALGKSGKDISLEEAMVGIKGEILE